MMLQNRSPNFFFQRFIVLVLSTCATLYFAQETQSKCKYDTAIGSQLCTHTVVIQGNSSRIQCAKMCCIKEGCIGYYHNEERSACLHINPAMSSDCVYYNSLIWTSWRKINSALWPQGTYGLMEAASGCPAPTVTWYEGWRNQDTEDDGSDGGTYTTSTMTQYMKASITSIWGQLTTYFCIKLDTQTTELTKPWPNGTFCILKRGSCPTGFQYGYITWDDEDDHKDGGDNANAYGGQMPDGGFYYNTLIYYCCRSDGSVYTPIHLPTDKPFILIQYQVNVCQAVYGMQVYTIYIGTDDEDDEVSASERSGAHPYDDGIAENHRLWFCHYQRL